MLKGVGVKVVLGGRVRIGVVRWKLVPVVQELKISILERKTTCTYVST